MNNRYNDKKGRYEIKPTTIETVDQAVYDYFDKKLSLVVDGVREDGEAYRSKVPVHFVGGERWKLIRKNKFRDENGTLILPVISVKRTNIDRTPGFGGMAQEVPEITISKRIHPKTSPIQNLIDSRRVNAFPDNSAPAPVYEYTTLPYPDFCTIFYEIVFWTQFQTQMNKILQKIFYKYDYRDSFVMPVDYDGKEPKGDGYYFVGFREGDVTPQGNQEDFTDQERIIKYIYNIKTPAYLMLDPEDETLSYGRDGAGKKVVHKYQSSVKATLNEDAETTLTVEKFNKIFES